MAGRSPRAEGRPVRAIVTDLDGTFLKSATELHPRSVEAFRGAARSGLGVVFATGRPPRWVDVLDPLADIEPVVISTNGAVLYDLARHEVLDHHDLDVADALDFAAALAERVPDVCFAVEYAHAEWGTDPRYERLLEEGRRRPASIAPLEELLGLDAAVKMLVVSPGTSTEALAEAARRAAGGRINVTFSMLRAQGLVECSAPGVTKAAMLADVLERMGVDPSEAMAFGDMPNDADMLDMVGHPYVMSNAHPSLLDGRYPVAGANTEGAVGAVVEREVLGGP